MVELDIKEMKCNHCVERIDNLLKELKIDHEVDLATKTVKLTSEDQVDHVIEELDDIGFTAKRK